MLNTTSCIKCFRNIRNNNWTRHDRSCNGPVIKKIRGVDFDPNFGYKDGSRSAWNKGLRSKPDNRNLDYVGKWGGYRANAGISKKFKVADSFGKETTLQSTYELLCSELLNEMNIKWVRPKALKYDSRNYFADFYLPDYNIYLDPKNSYKAKLDAEKIRKVVEQNNVQVFILLKEQITKEYISRLTEMD